MIKTLRYFLSAMLLLVCSASFAQTTVTFTAGTDLGANTKSGTADEVTKDGITISCTNAAFGINTGTQINYRFYQDGVATISSTVGNITKVEFTCTQAGETKYGPGCFTDATPGEYTFADKVGTWTGDAASFSLTDTKQVRATSIVVTYTPGGEAPSTVTAPTITGETPFTSSTTVTITAGEGSEIHYTLDGTTPDDRSDSYSAPFTLTETTTVKAIAYNEDGDASSVVTKEFVKQAGGQGSGTEADPYTVAGLLANWATDQEVVVKGYVTKVGSFNSKYGELDYYIADEKGDETNTFFVYNGYGLNGAKFTSADDLKVGALVTVKGKTKEHNGTKEFNYGSKILSMEGGEAPQPVDTLSYTAGEALAVLAAGTQTTNPVYVTGIVSQIDEVSTQYGNATYYLSDDGTTTSQLQVFRGKYLNNEKFTSEDQLKVGDKVKICGVLENYTKNETTTPEVKNSYIVETSNTTEPVKEDTLSYTVSEAQAVLAANQQTDKVVYVTGIVSQVDEVSTQYGNATYYLSDDGTTTAQLEVFRGKYLNNEKFTSEDQLKVGDKVKILGILKNYTKNDVTTPEVTNSYIVETSNSSEPVKQDTLSYTVAEASAVLAAGTETTDVVYITGIVSQIDEVSAQYGNATYYLSDDGTTTGQLEVFRGKYLNNEKFTSEDQLKVGDKVKIAGVLKNYTKNDTTTPEVTGSWIVEFLNPTGINAAEVKTVADENAPVYNLAGQRVGKSYKGIVIKNGKKYIVK